MILGYALLTAGVLAVLLLNLRSDAIVSGEKVLAGYAELANVQTATTLQNIERAVLEAEDILVTATRNRTVVDLNLLRIEFQDIMSDRPFLSSIVLVDAKGDIVLGRSAADTGRSVADRDYFIRQRAQPGSRLLWGAPIQARSNGEWFITATMPLHQADGTFDGLIVGSVPLAYFDKVWKIGDEVQGLAISLWREDGVLLMRSPFDEKVIGSSDMGTALFSRIHAGQTKGDFEAISRIDGAARLVVFRRLDAYPSFILTFTQTMDRALGAWWHAVWVVVAGWVTAAAALALLAAWAAREWNARRSLEDRYRVLFDANPTAMLVVDRDTRRFLAVNNGAVEQYGWSREEFLAMKSDDIYPPADLAAVTALRATIVAGPTRLLPELRHLKKDGAVMTIESNVRLIDFEGKAAMLSMARDVTARKAAERDLVQMEGQYRGLLEAAPDAMVVVNQSGEIVLVNVQAETQFGYRRDELLGQRVTNIIPKGFAERLVTDATRSKTDALAQEIGTGIELLGLRKDGAEFPIEIMLSPLKSADGVLLVTAAIRNISVRKAAEKHLTQMQGEYRGLLEAAPDAMVVVNQSGEIVLVNAQAETQFGYRRDELLGQPVTDIIPEGFAERLVTDATRSKTDALAQEIGTGIELSGKRKDGAEFPIEIMLSPLKSADGVLLVTAAIRNISVRKAAEKHLTQMQGEYRGLLEAAPDAMVVVNQSGEIVLVNVQAETQFGYRRDELLGQPVTDIIPEGFAERLVTDATRSETDALAQEIGTGIELSGKRKDGAEFPIEIMLSPLKSADGVLLVTAAIRNISVRKAAEKHLTQMEGQYRGLLEAAPDAMVVVNQSGEIVLVNAQAETQFGYRRDELLGQRVTNIIPEGFAERLVTDATRSETDALAQEIGTGIELSGKRKDGAEFPIEIMLSPLKSADGILLVTAAIRNISVRKAAEKHLTQMEGQYRGLLEAAPDAMVVVNQTGEIVLVNVQAETQFGYSRDELLGQPVTEIIPQGFAERLVTDATRSEIDALAQEIGTGIELLGRRRDGEEFPIEIMLSPLASTEGILVTAAIRNISVRKVAEDQLRQSQKMEAVGQLTGGIAHDFNNILFVILANTDALLEDEVFSPAVTERLGEIDKAVQRAADLTRQLLAFSRKQPLRPQQTDLNDIVSETGNLLRRSLGAQIEIDAVLAEDLSVVSIDRSQFETTLVNLCLNARDAMPGGGRLLIETRNVVLDEEYCIFNDGAVPGAYAMLSVTDEGAGIPSADLEKVFEPFFTTKEVGKGTGLGLSMVYGFIKQSNGHVGIYSEMGHGTSVKLYLPCSDGLVAEVVVRDKTPLPGGSERILVVEDEPQVRASVVRQLRSLGYTVAEAPDGTAGVAAFEAAAPSFDLLLSDVIMPGPLSGKLLAAEVARRWPAVKIVFMSGFTEISSVRHERLDEGALLLSKPFRKLDLARMIRHALDTPDA